MRFLQDKRPLQSNQTPVLVTMDAYPDWSVAPTYRCRLTRNAAYYDDIDLYETDNDIQAMGSDANYGFLHQAGRLY